jgi:hypothetical protein
MEDIQFNNILLIRRIVYGINMIVLYYSPFMQVVINSSFSFTICHYILIFKPFKTRLDNIMNFYIEFLTFLILSIIGAFIRQDLSSDLYALADWSLVVLIYSIIIVPAIVNLIISIKDLILYFKTISLRNRWINKNSWRNLKANQKLLFVFTKCAFVIK